jgi:hypothetical protein
MTPSWISGSLALVAYVSSNHLILNCLPHIFEIPFLTPFPHAICVYSMPSLTYSAFLFPLSGIPSSLSFLLLAPLSCLPARCWMIPIFPFSLMLSFFEFLLFPLASPFFLPPSFMITVLLVDVRWFSHGVLVIGTFPLTVVLPVPIVISSSLQTIQFSPPSCPLFLAPVRSGCLPILPPGLVPSLTFAVSLRIPPALSFVRRAWIP